MLDLMSGLVTRAFLAVFDRFTAKRCLLGKALTIVFGVKEEVYNDMEDLRHAQITTLQTMTQRVQEKAEYGIGTEKQTHKEGGLCLLVDE